MAASQAGGRGLPHWALCAASLHSCRLTRASPPRRGAGSSGPTSTRRIVVGGRRRPGRCRATDDVGGGENGSSAGNNGAGPSEPRSSAREEDEEFAVLRQWGTLTGGDIGDSTALPNSFCIIESPETVQDFAKLQLSEIRSGIAGRRTRIFLLMEEVRRLRIQENAKSDGTSLGPEGLDAEIADSEFSSVIPWLPVVSDQSIKNYYVAFALLVGGIITFGGYIAPLLELRLGLGGLSYRELISQLGLPSQLAEVDPIVASFSGGAVGVLSALLLVEMKNVRDHDKGRCCYCQGTGYLACAACGGVGRLVDSDLPEPAREAARAAAASARGKADGAAGPSRLAPRCGSCSGTGKVMCPSCLCTGKAFATEHDPRIDPLL